MSQSISESTWTAYPSLLSSLTFAEQDALEEAVCAGLCGRHDDCDRIFTEQLAHLSSTPAYVFNRADILTNMSRELERRQLLEPFDTEASLEMQHESMKILLRMMIEDNKFWLYGTPEPFRDALVAARKYLAHMDFTKLSDIDLRCMTAYYEGTNHLAKCSNLVVEKDKICCIRFRDQYTEMRELRTTLQNAQRYRFVVKAMQFEIKSWRTSQEFASSSNDAMSLVPILLQKDSNVLKHRGAVLADSLRSECKKNGQQKMAETLMNLKNYGLQAITPQGYANWQQFCPSLDTNDYADSIVSSSNTLQAKVDELTSLADSCVVRRDYTRANETHMKIRDLLHKAVTDGAILPEDDMNASTLVRNAGLAYVALHRDTTRLVFWEASALCDFMAHQYQSERHHREFLSLIRRFESEHPTMAIPNQLERLFDQAKASAKALYDDKTYKEYEDKHKSILNKCSFQNRDGGLVQEAIVTPGLAVRVIYAKGTDVLSLGIGALHLMLKWAVYEIKNGQLNEIEANQIFGDPSIAFTTISDEQLEEQAKLLFEAFCGTDTKWIPSAKFMQVYDRLLEWLQKPDRKPSRAERISTLIYFIHSRLKISRHHLTRLNPSRDVPSKEDATAFNEANSGVSREENALEELLKLHYQEENPNSIPRPDSVATDEYKIQRVLRHCRDFDSGQPISISILDDAIGLCGKLITEFSANNALLRWYFSLVQQLRLVWQKTIRVQKYTSSEIENIIGIVERADKVFDTIRSNLASPEASDEFISQVISADYFRQSEHYRFAVTALACRYKVLVQQDAAVSKEAQDFVNEIARWSLVAKGKSLLDILQTSQLMQRESRNGQWDELSERLSNLSLESPTSKTKTPEEMVSGTPSGVVIVDLVNLAYNPPYPKLMALIYERKKAIRMVDIPLNNHHISTWVHSNLDDLELEQKPLWMEDSQNKLDELRALIEAFLTPGKHGFIREDVTIVWCSTGSLHRVPIHAITAGDKPFIARNPIVYTQSLGLLLDIWERKANIQSFEPRSPTIINPLPSDWESSVAAKHIAAQLGNARALHGDDIKKIPVLEALQGSNIFNFQGHARFDSNDPLNSALRLRGKDESITVRNILEAVRLGFPALCTLLACRSGKTVITTTDDVLGLPTALHYAGASSVVSTLWPVDDADGAAFARFFYRELLAAKSELDNSVDSVDLSKIMQATIKSLYKESPEDKKNKPLYHWAAFFIQGDWLFPAASLRQSVTSESEAVSNKTG